MSKQKAKKETYPGDKLSGKKRSFEVTLSKTVTITLDENVIEQGLMPDHPVFGHSVSKAAARGVQAHTEAEHTIVDHLAYNLVGNFLRLSEIDGYANCPDAGAEVPYVQWDVESIYEVKGGMSPRCVTRKEEVR